MVVTGRLVALAAVGVVAAFVSPAALAGWVSAVLLAAAVDLAAAAPTHTVEVRRLPLAPTRLGADATSTLVVVNRSRRTARLAVRDQWVPSAGAAPAAHRLTLATGATAEVATVLRPTRRGTRPAVRVALRSLGPLGLAGWQRQRPSPGSLVVLPGFPSRRLLPEKLARVRELDGSVSARRAGRGTEFDALRPYVPGDDASAVDWRATARAGGVVVRTFRPEQDRRVLCVLDTGRGAAARVADEPRLDAALDAALLLTAVVVRAGDRVGLVAVDTVTRATLGVGGARDRLARTAALTADLHPRLVETDPGAVLAAVTATAGRRALVVLFTALDEGPRPAVVATVRGLVRDHTVVVAAVADPELDRLDGTAGGDTARDRTGSDPAADVYAAAAAALAREQRADLAAELARLGARVVDAPPARFASAVTDAYLDVKGAGRLS